MNRRFVSYAAIRHRACVHAEERHKSYPPSSWPGNTNSNTQEEIVPISIVIQWVSLDHTPSSWWKCRVAFPPFHQARCGRKGCAGNSGNRLATKSLFAVVRRGSHVPVLSESNLPGHGVMTEISHCCGAAASAGRYSVMPCFVVGDASDRSPQPAAAFHSNAAPSDPA
jgi:hypothetical protein